MENQRMLSTQEAVVGGTEGGPGPTGVPPATAAAPSARGGSAPLIDRERKNGRHLRWARRSRCVRSPEMGVQERFDDCPAAAIRYTLFTEQSHAESLSQVMRPQRPRKKSVQPLPNHRAMWDALVGSVASFVLVVDYEYTILFINQVEDGDSIDDAIGANALDFVQPEYKERVAQAFALVFSGKGIAEYEVASWDPAGNPTYYVSRLAPVVVDGKIVAGVMTCENVQHIRDTEASLRADRRALRHLITTQERERQLVSCEIHDGLSQYLVGAIMLLESREYGAANQGSVPREDLRESIALLRRAAAESRRLIQGLRPTMLDELGIVEAVRSVVVEARRTIPVVEYSHPESLPRFTSDVETTIFRIVQEALFNVMKHSKAHHARVLLEQHGEHELAIVVEDDGTGFDMSTVVEDRFGLESIRQRSRLFQREALISSCPGKGSRIEVVLPLFPGLSPPSE